jgi:hypothetical protein
MKRILHLLAGLLSVTTSYSAGLPIDFSKEFKYSPYIMNGMTFMVHSSLADNRAEMVRAIEYASKIFSEVEKTIPNTTKKFRKEKCKIFLYELEFSNGGMEYVRRGQSVWDKRHNSTTDHSIVIARAYSYSKTGHNGFAYLLHEMTHFHHLDILGNKLDNEIKKAYRLALSNPKYAGVYASSNYLEYFAEISTAYLLDAHRTSRFPKGSKELYTYDKVGYSLCKKAWGEERAAYRPPAQVAVVAARPYRQPYRQSSPRPAVAQHNPSCRCTRCSVDHATNVFKMPTEDGVLMSKKFLEIVYLINRTETERNDRYASWMYSNALFMLRTFQSEYPNYRTGVVKGMIRDVTSRIN